MTELIECSDCQCPGCGKLLGDKYEEDGELFVCWSCGYKACAEELVDAYCTRQEQLWDDHVHRIEGSRWEEERR